MGQVNEVSSGHVLECKAVERRFGGLVALSGVDLAIDRGEIFGLVGPNGSGKTTLINAITGFFPPQTRPHPAQRPRHHRRSRRTRSPAWASRAPSRTWPCSTA